MEEMEIEEEEREERWCRPERLEGYLERGVCGCAWVLQWQQLFGLYTTARIRYRPLSPGASSLSVSFPDAASHPFFGKMIFLNVFSCQRCGRGRTGLVKVYYYHCRLFMERDRLCSVFLESNACTGVLY